MALKPEARYASPQALAEDLERALADEPVTAYPEPFTRRSRRWARKHQTALAIGTTAAAVAALLLGSYAWQRYDRRWTAETSAAIMLAQAERLASEARAGGDPTAWIKAIAEAQRAVDQLESGGGDVSEAKARLKLLQADSRMVAELDEARIRSADVRDEGYNINARLATYLAAFRTYGIDLESLSVEEAAKRVRSSRIADDLISALDDWAYYTLEDIPLPRPRVPRSGLRSILAYSTRQVVPRARLQAITRAVDSDPVRVAIREAIARRDAAGLRRLCEKEEDRRNLGSRLRYVFDSLRRLDPVASYPLLEAIRRQTPSDFWLNQDLGMAYLNARPPQLQEAVRCLSAATALRPNSPGVHLNLGSALKAKE